MKPLHITLALWGCVLTVVLVGWLGRSNGALAPSGGMEKRGENSQPGRASPQRSVARDSRHDDPPGIGATPLVIEAAGDRLRVTHQLGAVLAPRQPTRVCSLACTDELLAIGLRPVAAACANGKFPDYLKRWLTGVTRINRLMGVAQPDLETLSEARPELIIASAGDPQTYSLLSKIAPVVVLADDGANYRQRVLDLGRLLGRDQVAIEQVERYDRCVAESRAILADRVGDARVAFFRVFGKQLYIHGHTRGGMLMYDELGLRPPTLIASSPKGYALSPESLLQLDADHIFVAAEANAGAQRSWSGVLSHPAWGRVPAVKSGNVYPLAEQQQWLHPGFLARSRMLDEIMSALAPDVPRLPTPSARAADWQAAR